MTTEPRLRVTLELSRHRATSRGLPEDSAHLLLEVDDGVSVAPVVERAFRHHLDAHPVTAVLLIGSFESAKREIALIGTQPSPWGKRQPIYVLPQQAPLDGVFRINAEMIVLLGCDHTALTALAERVSRIEDAAPPWWKYVSSFHSLEDVLLSASDLVDPVVSYAPSHDSVAITGTVPAVLTCFDALRRSTGGIIQSGPPASESAAPAPRYRSSRCGAVAVHHRP
ncbi:MAG: hypothetical protein NVS1B4_01700 [Gemmatimonadaceae bacterium]